MIQPERIKKLKGGDHAGRYVLYWMQQSQRAAWNHALEYAVREANVRKQPVVVVFGLTDAFPEANLRHYVFLIEGLRDTARALRRRGIRLVVRRASPEKAALALAKDASLLVADRGYLRIQRRWRQAVADRAPCPVVQVESDVVVPVEAASDKEEYAARTLRPKILRALQKYLVPLRHEKVRHPSLKMRFDGVDVDDIDAVLATLKIDRSVAPSPVFSGGAGHAKRLLADFVANKLARYATDAGNPALDGVSHLSPYLHFGQVSPVYVALQVLGCRGHGTAADDFLEQLIVRRELAMNFVEFNDRYDAFDVTPDWAKKTLGRHRRDRREHVYSLADWERAETHDRWWNAAQREMALGGKMHNYMRMYWGKKLIEWSASPEEAFETALHLNNKYELDGRDPNGFAGVAWCFGKHDRAWSERPVLGKLRYLSAAGLERKFDMAAYARRVDALTGERDGDG